MMTAMFDGGGDGRVMYDGDVDAHGCSGWCCGDVDGCRSIVVVMLMVAAMAVVCMTVMLLFMAVVDLGGDVDGDSDGGGWQRGCGAVSHGCIFSRCVLICTTTSTKRTSTRHIPAAIFNKEESQLISTLLPIPKSHHFPSLWSRSYMQNLNGIPHYRNLTTLDEDVFYKIQSVRYAMATLSTWFDVTDFR